MTQPFQLLYELVLHQLALVALVVVVVVVLMVLIFRP
jgi:hypothetical protein